MLDQFEKVLNLCRGRGFVFPGSEIYGGLANSWDYGPLGILLKNHLQTAWWNFFVRSHRNMVGLDSSILLNPKVWEAAGHLENFSDPLIDCKKCKSRHRADKLIEEFWHKKDQSINPDGWTDEATLQHLIDNKILCPKCGSLDYSNIKRFNLMFKTKQGVTEDGGTDIYMRPETAQGIFINFKNVLQTSRQKVPFGIAQVGKAFRNEITPGNFIFRTREFEQMEIEFFVKPGEGEKWQKYWEAEMKKFLSEIIKINHPEDLRVRWHEKEALSHYSKATFDIEYLFPFGWSELWGCAHRGNYDLTQHSNFSGEKLEYLDP
ncbi:MAG TPA: glycine--tRNA ligase, partial [Candidatus Gracilibacteria bacterium]|nr:glycine--tRNA ligase [Candidatus Gracilibacteria bacterium]